MRKYKMAPRRVFPLRQLGQTQPGKRHRSKTIQTNELSNEFKVDLMLTNLMLIKSWINIALNALIHCKKKKSSVEVLNSEVSRPRRCIRSTMAEINQK